MQLSDDEVIVGETKGWAGTWYQYKNGATFVRHKDKPSTLKQWGVLTGGTILKGQKGANIATKYFTVYAHSAKGALKKIVTVCGDNIQLDEIKRIKIY